MGGVAYEIDDQEWKNSVMAHLDHREKGGYTQHSVQFYPRQAENGMPSEGVTVTVYVGDTSHRQYAGPDSLEVMAKTSLPQLVPVAKTLITSITWQLLCGTLILTTNIFSNLKKQYKTSSRPNVIKTLPKANKLP